MIFTYVTSPRGTLHLSQWHDARAMLCGQRRDPRWTVSDKTASGHRADCGTRKRYRLRAIRVNGGRDQ